VTPVDLSPLGLAVGHATDAEGGTGLTVVRGIDLPFHCGTTVLGRASGSRELAVLEPRHLVDRVDAVVLTGGSAYGLGAAEGVMRWMEARGRGFRVPGGVVPIVPAAVIFDLAPIGRFDARPSAQMAFDACERASSERVSEGSVGVGTGAVVGKGLGIEHCMKGGFGCWQEQQGVLSVVAMAVVNALGDVRDADGLILAGARGPGGFRDVARSVRTIPLRPAGPATLQHTTLAVVATNAALDRQALQQLSAAAGAALFRRITPAGTSFDGDTIFAIAPLEAVPASQLQVEVMAVYALEMAIERAVRLARGTGGVPGLADDGGAAT
jgi:L-aminopeptidase/D-esterase-like protein